MFITVEQIAKEPVVYILRYVRQLPTIENVFPKYDAVCIAVQEDEPESCLIKALAGKITKEVLQACAVELEKLGFNFVIGYRKGYRFVKYPITKLKGG